MPELLRSISRRCKRWRKRGETKTSGNASELSKDLATIEKQTGRTVSIATTTTHENLQRCHPQDQSPLFHLPAEIRNLIFTYALTPDPRKDSFDAQLLHPIDRFSPQVLQTCRRIWLEANTYLLDNATPEFFLYRSNPFGDAIEESEATIRGIVELERFLRKLTPNSMQMMNLTINVDMAVLTQHNSIRTFAIACESWPARLTMTLRLRRYAVRPLAADSDSAFDGAEGVISEVLQHATLVKIKRITLRMQAVAERRDQLRLAALSISMASNRDVLAPGWVLDEGRCRSLEPDDHSTEGSQLDVVVLEWYRIDDDASPTANKEDPETSGEVQKDTSGVTAAYSKQWKKQGSLLRFLD